MEAMGVTGGHRLGVRLRVVADLLGAGCRSVAASDRHRSGRLHRLVASRAVRRGGGGGARAQQGEVAASAGGGGLGRDGRAGCGQRAVAAGPGRRHPARGRPGR